MCYRLGSLRCTGGLLQAVFLHKASFPAAASLVGFFHAGKSVIWFDVTVAACKRDTNAWHTPVDPGLISDAEHLPKPVSHTASATLELFCDAFANKKGRGHPWGRQAVGPRRFVLAFLAVALRRAGIRNHPFLLARFGDQ